VIKEDVSCCLEKFWKHRYQLLVHNWPTYWHWYWPQKSYIGQSVLITIEIFNNVAHRQGKKGCFVFFICACFMLVCISIATWFRQLVKIKNNYENDSVPSTIFP